MGTADKGVEGPEPQQNGCINPGPVEFNMYGPMVHPLEGDQKFILLTGKSGARWVVADQENAAEFVFMDGGAGSSGMAGRTMTFDLVEGGSVDFIGPWKTTSDNLFDDTGHDVRSKYFSQGIIAFERLDLPGTYSPHLYRGVLHYDADPVLRKYNWLDGRAQEIANFLGISVFAAQRTRSGGHAGLVKPKETAG